MYLEKVTEGPISEHLKESVMVGVLPNVVKVIVLTTSSNALLRVDSARQLSKVTARIHGALEYGLELWGEGERERERER